MINASSQASPSAALRALYRAAGVALATFACLGAARAAEPIKLGIVLSTTGGASYLGDPAEKALKLYIDRINKAGGVIGRPLQAIFYDDAGDANRARTFATRLVENDRVQIVLGGSTTGTTMAMVPVFEGAEIPYMSVAGGVNIVEPVRKWVFKSPQTDRMGCQRIFADLKARKLTNIALIAGTDGFGTSMRAQCVKVAPDYGVKIVAEQSYGVTDTDMTPQLLKLKGAPGVQAIVNTGASGQGAAILTRNYGQLGMQKIPLYQNPGVASKSFIQLAGAAAEGVRLPAPALLIGKQLPDSDPQKRVVLDFTQVYEQGTGQPVSSFAGGAYDALMMVVDAIKRANGTDPAKVRDALEKTRGYIGTAGIVNMSPKDHLGLPVDAYRLLEIHDGDWKLVQ
ncbi:ABC transporter substrate-binding protein [Chitinasiproducens palmae]|uniref:Amino acid/amide ABC transporter substrate-binding protein, HAAT family n=1 Tax=Chitinasiproducens palmae TaxID=1770053 RepID=A0A1H2PTW6_9BURK|nr:ABC transporter substrate-binding protein [Chitinasiproducens palmae]SDV50575.1 amino acid/amide ABC transporter substrate-binding protein, HAAT family [Chitinasiproducens palmae]